MRTTHVHAEKKKPEPPAVTGLHIPVLNSVGKREREEPGQTVLTPLSKFDLLEADRIHHRLQTRKKDNHTPNLATGISQVARFDAMPRRFHLCLDFPSSIQDKLVCPFVFRDGEKQERFCAAILSPQELPEGTLFLDVEYIPRTYGQNIVFLIHEISRRLPNKKVKVAEPDPALVMQQAVRELKAEMEPRIKAALVAKWEPIITRDLLQRSQSDLDRKKIEVESRLKEIQVAQALNLFPPNQEELANIINQDD